MYTESPGQANVDKYLRAFYIHNSQTCVWFTLNCIQHSILYNDRVYRLPVDAACIQNV